MCDPSARLVSFVIPTLREDALDETLDRLTDHLTTIAGYRFEVLLVDDSPEPYRDAIRRYVARHTLSNSTVRLLEGSGNGKGAANKLGVLASSGDVVFTIDADLPVPLTHVEEFLRVLEAPSVDVCIAERPLARNLNDPVRFVLSRGLFVLARVFVFQSTEFLDTQCGFKAYRGDLIRSIVRRQVVDGGMCDIEYLYAAVARGASIAKQPVTPNPEARPSKINVWKCLVTDPVALARVKVRGLRGQYR
jgi:dolichyl-phosphate beta-glucosyltransferase